MGRGDDIHSANSELFFMRVACAFKLNLHYIAWGNTIYGREVIMTLNAGEPPAHPDTMQRVQVAADMPASERPVIEMLDTRDPAFARIVNQVRAQKGAEFSICDIQVPTRLKSALN